MDSGLFGNGEEAEHDGVGFFVEIFDMFVVRAKVYFEILPFDRIYNRQDASFYIPFENDLEMPAIWQYGAIGRQPWE